MSEDKTNKTIELKSEEYLEHLRTLKEALNISEDRYKFLIKKFHVFMDNVKDSVVVKNKMIEEIRQDLANKEVENTVLKDEIEKSKVTITNLEKKIIQKEIEIDELKIKKVSENFIEEKKIISTIIKKEKKNDKGDDFIYLGKK